MKKRLAMINGKQICFVLFFMLLDLYSITAFAIEPLGDEELNNVIAQDGMTVILDDFKFTHHTSQTSIGGEDGLGTPSAPDGAWFVFESTRVLELDLAKASFDIDVFTSNEDGLIVNGCEAVPALTSAALINFGEAYFHLNMSDALLTLKFANNPQGNTGDGITQFSDTVCNFALDGSIVTFKSEDARMYIYAH